MSDAWKVAVVTGASQGVGEGIVKAFLERWVPRRRHLALDQAVE
jgi:NAD(P)-dependent dehydrogenase (short-subunit alcohol dehydrogenase family)